MSEATPETIVPVWEAYNLTKAEFDALPPTTRIDLERVHHTKAPDARRPRTRALTPAELVEFEAQAAHHNWSWAERRERARVLQQTPAPGQP